MKRYVFNKKVRTPPFLSGVQLVINAFYFGMLIPMSAMESEGYLLPVIFALATGLPVMLVAWILAYSVAGIGKFYNRVQTFQKWFNNMVAILFILVGIYYGLINWGII